MTIKEAKNIYCVGIGGIGVSGLARLFLAMDKNVSGSDLRQSTVTDGLEKIGVKIFIGHNAKNLESAHPDLIVYSEDVSKTSPGFVEILKADELGIAKITQAQALGQLFADKYGIGITGTNGKSTTTALLGLILEEANLDPTVFIGSLLSPKNESEKFKANARLGQGRYFVAESDEYNRKMLENKPKMIVLTNIAEDHLDCYKDLQDIKSAFLQYVESLPNDGILIYNSDDHNTVDVCREAKCHKFTFGVHHYADLQVLNVEVVEGKQTFDMHLNDQLIGKFELHSPGLFNVSNAVGASLAAIKLGVDIKVVASALSKYAGIWRRFEIVGETNGKIIISDYAHHPDAVFATIEAAKSFYPKKKILTVFQPHHRNRTKMLFTDFVKALEAADDLIVPEIFDVAGREHGEEVSSRQLTEELKSKGERVSFVKDLDDAEKLIREKLPNFDMVLLMGAGDIDGLARKLVK